MNWKKTRGSGTLAGQLAEAVRDGRQRARLAGWALACGCVLTLAVFVGFSLPKPIETALPASIFENGVAVGETTISLKGHLQHTPFSESQTYTGRFWLDCFDPARKPQSDAILQWAIPFEECAFLPRPDSASTFAEVEAVYADLELQQITIQLTDGTVISTAEAPAPALLKA